MFISIHHQADHVEIIEFEIFITGSISFVNILFISLFLWIFTDCVFQGVDLFHNTYQKCDNTISMDLLYYPLNVYRMCEDMVSFIFWYYLPFWLLTHLLKFAYRRNPLQWSLLSPTIGFTGEFTCWFPLYDFIFLCSMF